MEIVLNVKNRIQEVTLPDGISQILFQVSRTDCKDILLELIHADGQAKGKPLFKYLPKVNVKSVSSLRFMMNDYSTRPITIKMKYK